MGNKCMQSVKPLCCRAIHVERCRDIRKAHEFRAIVSTSARAHVATSPFNDQAREGTFLKVYLIYLREFVLTHVILAV